MIKISIRSIDGFSKTRTFKTIEGARRLAQYHVGKHPDSSADGSPQTFGYAVSWDGVVTAHWDGTTYDQLFPRDAVA